jgi:hypothetical protein
MMIDDVVTLFGTKDHRNHMVAKKSADFLGRSLAQTFALGSDLLHADRNLRRPQAFNTDWSENRITYEGHVKTSRNKRCVQWPAMANASSLMLAT